MGNNNKFYEKSRLEKCQVCKKQVMVDSFGHGDCENCGWIQSEDGKHNYDIVRYPNFVSFARAKELNMSGQKIKTRIEDFVGMFENYGEVGFVHKGLNYGLIAPRDGILIFFRENDEKFNEQKFNTSDEFTSNSHISGQLLKDIWHEISEVNWLI